MKIAFISNFYNHHQQPISEQLYALTNGDYRFISTTEIPEERKALGYREEMPPFVLKSFLREDEQEVQRWLCDADVVVSGNVDQTLLKERLTEKKLILRYSERPLKNGFEWYKYPYRFLRWKKSIPHSAPIYLLCAGAYTAKDYAAFGLFRDKALKWGYFPAVYHHDTTKLLAKKDKKEIIWCGRFLDWKHPDDVLKAAKALSDDGLEFHISIIGTGEMNDELHRCCSDYQLGNRVSFLGAMSPEKVRSHMEQAGVFLLTSDRKEGWGAVLNEAMNSACAVIATREAGSTPYLVTDGVNGLTYHSGDTDMLYKSVKRLLEHPKEQEKIGAAAYQTMIDEWSPEIAAERLIRISEMILADEDFLHLYSSGPCSPA